MEKIKKANEVVVFHLVRVGNGISPLSKFVKSYKRNPAGGEHDLIIIFKGFVDREGKKIIRKQEELGLYKEILKGISHDYIYVDDEGYDVNAYMYAFNKNQCYEYYYFLNSYSEILFPNWLNKNLLNIQDPQIGLVGASGSTQSLFSEQAFRNARFSHIRKLHMKVIRVLLTPLIILIKRCIYYFYFDPYPNYHVRTNAFMIRRDVLEKVNIQKIKTKVAALRFESGKKGLSRQVLDMGLELAVVNCDGVTSKKEEWHESNTFWQGDQGKLLIADNQTRAYESGNNHFRKYLSRLAWRYDAKPVLSENTA